VTRAASLHAIEVLTTVLAFPGPAAFTPEALDAVAGVCGHDWPEAEAAAYAGARLASVLLQVYYDAATDAGLALPPPAVLLARYATATAGERA
jgi:hypothetical protein